MKKTVIFATIFAIVFSICTLAFAAWMRIILIDSQEREFGTATNPIYIQGV